MIQKKFNVNFVDEYFKVNPSSLNIKSNKDLYIYCYAETDAQKQNVRRRKKQIKENKVVSNNDKKASDDAGEKDETRPSNLSSNSNPGKKLSEEFLENIIRDGLDDNPNNVQLIGKAVDFFVKVKTDKKEGTKQMLNMEGFLKLADANREK